MQVRFVLGTLLTTLSLSACDERRAGTGGGAVGTGTAPSATPSAASAATASAPDAPEAPAPSAAPPATPTPDAALPSYDVGATTWVLGEVHDLGPAGPTTATRDGVLFVTLDGQLLRATRQGKTFTPLDEPPERFAKYGRGPAVTERAAYWITADNRLLRGARPGQEPTVISESARSGTRVSALTAQGRDLVAFIRDVDEDPRAFVWAEKDEIVQVSADSSSATSVEIVAGKPHPHVLVLEGRTGMSPLHYREVRVTKRQLTVMPDEVIWVGPGSQPLTELQTLSQPEGETLALLATSRDVTHFGLAHFIVTNQGKPDTPAWRAYPNGIDPAPVAAEHLCGRDYVVYATPTEVRPRSPQELRIARVVGGDLAEEEVLARSRAFNDVSLAASSDGAVLSWTADRRTWGVVLGCPPPAAKPTSPH